MGRDTYFLFLLIRDGFFKVADGRLFQKLQNLERGKITGEVEPGRVRPGELGLLYSLSIPGISRSGQFHA